MNEKQIALLVIGPMVVGTAVLLWRQGAMGIGQVAAVALAVAVVAGFMILNF
jgi:hypothetical protein